MEISLNDDKCFKLPKISIVLGEEKLSLNNYDDGRQMLDIVWRKYYFTSWINRAHYSAPARNGNVYILKSDLQLLSKKFETPIKIKSFIFVKIQKWIKSIHRHPLL